MSTPQTDYAQHVVSTFEGHDEDLINKDLERLETIGRVLSEALRLAVREGKSLHFSAASPRYERLATLVIEAMDEGFDAEALAVIRSYVL